MSPPCDRDSALDRPFCVLNVLSHGGPCVGRAETSQCSQLTLGLNFAGGYESLVTYTLLYNRSARGHRWAAIPGAASDLPEDCHGAGKASGSVKSSINQAVLVTGSLELAGLEGEGKILWAQEVFTLLDVALVPPREAYFSTREGIHHWAGSLTAWSHNRERKACRAPWREGEHLANGPACPLLSFTRACYSWYHSIPTGLCLPWHSPEASAAWETLQGLQTTAASQGTMLREKQGPHPPSTSSFPSNS